MDIETVKLIERLGVSGTMLACCIWLVRYIVMQLKEEIKQISVSTTNLVNETNSLVAESREAHRYQREEHKEIADILKSIKRD